MRNFIHAAHLGVVWVEECEFHLENHTFKSYRCLMLTGFFYRAVVWLPARCSSEPSKYQLKKWELEMLLLVSNWCGVPTVYRYNISRTEPHELYTTSMVFPPIYCASGLFVRHSSAAFFLPLFPWREMIRQHCRRNKPSHPSLWARMTIPALASENIAEPCLQWD